MKLSAAFHSIVGIILCLLLAAACKKSNVSGGSGGTNTPYITPIGDTAGALVSASIGPTGGSLTSSDGRVQLMIPAGALSQTIIISIQPIINLCPGGIGLAYDLQPTGTKFSTPASLVFHYSDSDMNGTEPLLITSAFQDSANAWEFNDTEKDVDSINKTISFDINHFTPYGFIPELVIYARPPFVKENETSLVKVQQWIVPKDLSNYKEGKFVQSKADVANSLVTNWRVSNGANASGAEGTISGDGSSAVYKAPSNIDKDKYVLVSCDINQTVTVKLKGGRIFTTQVPLHEEALISLISGVFSFNLSILVTMHQTSWYFPDVYTDGATMQVDVKYDQVNISNIINRAPTVNPAVGQAGDLSIAWVPDIIGVTNITPASTGTVSPDLQGGGDDIITLTLTHTATVWPKWLSTDKYGNTATSGGFSVGGTPGLIVFRASDHFQTVTNLLNPDGIDTYTVTETPRH